MKPTDDIEDERLEILEGGSAVDSLFLRMIGEGNQSVAGPALTGVVVGKLIGYAGNDRTPLVQYSGQMDVGAAAARSIVALADAQIGRHVVLMFEGADASKPIIMGVLRDGDPSGDRRCVPVEVHVDGERVVIEASNQLVLRCGRASITLTKAGKVLIQGEYVSSRSVGVHRIKGGSVQIN